MGTAFRIREFVERPAEWADVRASASGYYFHPRSGNEAGELKGAEQKQITRLFARQRVITERNNGGQDGGDEPQYNLMRECGMTPLAGLVAEINVLEPWAVRVTRSHYSDAGQRVDVPLFADQRPWTSEWNLTADLTLPQIEALAKTNAGLQKRLDIITSGAGLALETDLNRSTTDGRVDPTLKHFRICRRMLEFARAKGKDTMLFLHGFEDKDVEH